MANYSAIHETVIRDIVDIISDVKDGGEHLFNRNTFKSVSHASDQMTLVFPVLCSSSVSVTSATMVAKAIERKAATMLQMLFSAININSTNNGIDYLRQFHTNLKMDDAISIDSYIDMLNNLDIEEATKLNHNKEFQAIKEDLKYYTNYIIPEAINPVALTEYRVINTYGKEKVIHKKKPVNEVEFDTIDYQNFKRFADTTKNQLLPSDVKKANEIVPTMLIVNFINDAEECPIESSMVIGVKAKLYPINSGDIMERLYSRNQDNNGFLKLIRATTREISFFKDFIFAVDKAKIDALSSSRRGSSSKLWKILERRSLKSKIRRALMQPNDASAISTLVVSQEEVEFLKKNYNVHIDNPRVIRPIMEAYNLMGVVLVNELDETCSFIFDTGSDVYEKVAFRSLEREDKDNDFKKMINLMTKMR